MSGPGKGGLVVIASLSVVIVLYAVLGAATIAILRLLSRRWRGGLDCGRGGVLMAADAVGGILLAGVTLYAVLGGADFGGGLWDLLAGTTARERAPAR
jgi:hypothetical protein